MADSTTSLKNVLLIGTGNAGGPILRELVNNKSKLNIHVFTRKENDPSLEEYKAQGVTIVKGDPKDKTSLVNALKGIDVIISTVGSRGFDDQFTFIDAAIEAGVKRFIPSEFGVNHNHPALGGENHPVFSKLCKTAKLLEEKAKEGKITYTLFHSGSWPEWGLKNGFLGFNLAEKKATIFGDGNKKTPFSTLESVSKYVVAAILNPAASENKDLKLADFQITQNELLEALEKATGTKWTTTTVSSDELKKKAAESLQKGDYSGVQYLIQDAIYNVVGPHDQLDNSKFPEVKQPTLADVIKSVV